MGWTRDLWNIGYPSLTTTTPYKSQKILSIKEHWVEIYSNQKAIKYISPSNIRALPSYPIYSNSLPLLSLTFYGPPPPHRASRGSAIHVFLEIWDLKILIRKRLRGWDFNSSGAHAWTSVILAGKRDSRPVVIPLRVLARVSYWRNKLLNVGSFIILRYGEGLTSFVLTRYNEAFRGVKFLGISEKLNFKSLPCGLPCPRI